MSASSKDRSAADSQHNLPLRAFADEPAVPGPVTHASELRNVLALGLLFTMYQGCRTGCLVVLPMACKELLSSKLNYAEHSPLYQLPFATWFAMDILLAAPNAIFMRRWGRRLGFLLGGFGGFLGSLLAWATLKYCDDGILAYGLLNLAIVILSAIGMTEFVRYAAAEACSDPQRRSVTVSRVVSGAAILSMVGPLSASAASWLEHERPLRGYATFFLGTAVLCLVHMASSFTLRLPPIDDAAGASDAVPRARLSQILRRPAVVSAILAQVAVQFAMITPMSALPLRMSTHFEGMRPADLRISGCVVLHVFCMFAPGFFTGDFIVRFELIPVMSVGLCLQAVCMAISLLWSRLWDYYLAMALLGVGWNLAFISSTVMLLESHSAAERTKVTSTNEIIRFAANGIAAVVSSTVAWEAVNCICLGLVLLVALILLQRRQR